MTVAAIAPASVVYETTGIDGVGIRNETGPLVMRTSSEERTTAALMCSDAGRGVGARKRLGMRASALAMAARR